MSFYSFLLFLFELRFFLFVSIGPTAMVIVNTSGFPRKAKQATC
jgi:hypothetical protein